MWGSKVGIALAWAMGKEVLWWCCRGPTESWLAWGSQRLFNIFSMSHQMKLAVAKIQTRGGSSLNRWLGLAQIICIGDKCYTGWKRAWTSAVRSNSMEAQCTTTSRLGSFLALSSGRKFTERVSGEGLCIFVHFSPLVSAYGHCWRQYIIWTLGLTPCSCFYVLTVSGVDMCVGTLSWYYFLISNNAAFFVCFKCC